MVNRIWSNAVAGEAESVRYVSALAKDSFINKAVLALACHKGGPDSLNPGQFLLVYGTFV